MAEMSGAHRSKMKGQRLRAGGGRQKKEDERVRSWEGEKRLEDEDVMGIFVIRGRKN
jgi:hypothetical protein